MPRPMMPAPMTAIAWTGATYFSAFSRSAIAALTRCGGTAHGLGQPLALLGAHGRDVNADAAQSGRDVFHVVHRTNEFTGCDYHEGSSFRIFEFSGCGWLATQFADNTSRTIYFGRAGEFSKARRLSVGLRFVVGGSYSTEGTKYHEGVSAEGQASSFARPDSRGRLSPHDHVESGRFCKTK